MLTPLKYTVPIEKLKTAINSVDISQARHALNEPTGNFFYDPWTIKKEYIGTIWEEILNTLPETLGEARLIILKHGTCYMSHADIDDRYHLNIDGEYSFLVNIDTQEMFPQTCDGRWYIMDASPRHSAVNFGSIDRVQLVIRKLLNKNHLIDFSTVVIKPKTDKPRFIFDDEISPWLSKLNKQGLMNNFKILQDGVEFNIDKSVVHVLDGYSKDKFDISIL